MTTGFMAESRPGRAGRLMMRLRRLWPSSPDSHGRDGSGSTATPVRAPTGVVTAAIGVVHSPCDKTRPEPARPAGDREESPSRGGRHTSSPDEDVAKSRTGSRLSHPFQEEMMHMTRGWTGLRTAVIALGLLAAKPPVPMPTPPPPPRRRPTCWSTAWPGSSETPGSPAAT